MNSLLIVRPEPGCTASVAAARAIGLEAIAAPLFEIEPVAWAISEQACDAILAGSTNAFRHSGPQLAALRHLPVYAVGQTTAAAANDAGFEIAEVGEGGLQSLLDTLTGPLRLLRLAGSERVPLSPPPCVELVERVVYIAEPRPLSHIPTEPTVVALHSAAAARHFAAECDRLGLDRRLLSLACIGQRVSAAAGPGWADARAAARPDDAALLALAAEMCQTPA